MTDILSDKQKDSKEIQKVKNRIEGWFIKKEQKNSKILYAFIRLFERNNGIVRFKELEKESGIKEFKSNFDQMKNISEKNHGKIFEQKGENIYFWMEVEGIIWDYYKKYRKP